MNSNTNDTDTTKPASKPGKAKRRSEKAGVFHFGKDMASALIMALIAIVYVIQAFKIPTGSMEQSLLVGDFLLGLKFVYGAPVLPFSYNKLPGITNPKPGDVIIFKYPGPDKKDYIKRCVAGPGQTITSNNTTVTVNGVQLVLPPKGQYILDGQLDSVIRNFSPLYVPKKGDTLRCNPDMPLREAFFYRNLIYQEHPHDNVFLKFQLYINGQYSNDLNVMLNGYEMVSMDRVNEALAQNRVNTWIELQHLFETITSQFPGKTIEFKTYLYWNNKSLTSYVAKNDNYFMMGDNRDDSQDSRYWGFLNRNFIKAKAFILYFSLDSDTPWYLLPQKIRWNRMGKLIQSWDGQPHKL